MTYPIQRRLLLSLFEVARSVLLTPSSSPRSCLLSQRARSCFALRSSIQLSGRSSGQFAGRANRPDSRSPACPAYSRAEPVGQERFELSTPRLSSVCSNQLSYWPVGLIGLSRPNSKPHREPCKGPLELPRGSSFVDCGIDRNRLGRSR
jgi:hypothetical protein